MVPSSREICSLYGGISFTGSLDYWLLCRVGTQAFTHLLVRVTILPNASLVLSATLDKQKSIHTCLDRKHLQKGMWSEKVFLQGSRHLEQFQAGLQTGQMAEPH